MSIETPETPTPRSRTLIYIGLGLVLIIALVGAAFLAGRLLNQAAAPAGPPGIVSGPGNAIGVGGGPGSGGLSINGEGPGGDVMSVQIQVTPAPELPKLPPEVAGMFVSREDNRLFVSAGNMGMIINEGGDITQTGGDGPKVEVVVTQDTQVYRETTQLDPNDPPDGALQQTVAAGSIDELSSNTSVIVWGRRTGDRVIADVLLYSQPMMISRPGP